jgi:hypothetical protein|tara:strand:- start:5073 stop:5264 length:192 start_codon:yes stop_codon:yes gene_type:complete
MKTQFITNIKGLRGGKKKELYTMILTTYMILISKQWNVSIVINLLRSQLIGIWTTIMKLERLE